jgi:hypothetical protein
MACVRSLLIISWTLGNCPETEIAENLPVLPQEQNGIQTSSDCHADFGPQFG